MGFPVPVFGIGIYKKSGTGFGTGSTGKIPVPEKSRQDTKNGIRYRDPVGTTDPAGLYFKSTVLLENGTHIKPLGLLEFETSEMRGA